jgi:site-specific recombinase XerD
MDREGENAPNERAGEPGTLVVRRPPRSDQRDKLDTVHLTSPQEARLRLEGLRQATEDHVRRSKAPATQRAYASGFGSFALWCEQHGLDALPAEPDTVALYLTALAEQDAAVATLRIRLVCIAQAHKAAGFPPPTQAEVVRRTMSGIARTKGTRQRQVAPLRLTGLRTMLEATPEDDLLAIRDRAILLLGFAGGMRRSELAALDVDDLAAVDEGLDVLIRWSKTDQEGAGRTIGIPYGRNAETCPVLAVQRWIRLAGLTTGALFRRIRPNGRPGTERRDPLGQVETEALTPQGIARVIQRAAERAGLDAREYAGHSLRAGFATEAAAQGASERAIMQQTGHKSVAMLRRYIRDGDRYRDNAASLLGL